MLPEMQWRSPASCLKWTGWTCMVLLVKLGWTTTCRCKFTDTFRMQHAQVRSQLWRNCIHVVSREGYIRLESVTACTQ